MKYDRHLYPLLPSYEQQQQQQQQGFALTMSHKLSVGEVGARWSQ